MKTTNYLRYPFFVRQAGKMSSDDVLKAIGLQARRGMARNILSGVGLLSAGMLMGAALGMAFAPSRGEQIRREMRARAESMKARVGQYTERAKKMADDGTHEAPPPS